MFSAGFPGACNSLACLESATRKPAARVRKAYSQSTTSIKYSDANHPILSNIHTGINDPEVIGNTGLPSCVRGIHDPLAARMTLPCREHLINKTLGESAVLIEEHHPRKATALGPTNALIQGFSNTEVLSIFD